MLHFKVPNCADIGYGRRAPQKEPRKGDDDKARLAPTFPVKAPPRPPATEDLCSSKEWLARYGLRRQKLDFDSYTRPHVLFHDPKEVADSGSHVGARFCEIFAIDTPGLTSDIRRNASFGQCRHILLSLSGWLEYIRKLENILKRFEKRLRWLQTGSRQVFGVLLESRPTILIDTSGSMVASLPFLQKHLALFLTEQVRPYCTLLNMMQFSNEVRPWTDCLITVDDDTVAGAAAWLQTLTCGGGTDVMSVVARALDDDNTDVLYLVSDGMPEESCLEVVERIKRMLVGRPPIVLHTVAYNCETLEAALFLRDLAHAFGGRFHHFAPCSLDAQGVATGFDASGDDVDRLRREILRARDCIARAHDFRERVAANLEATAKTAVAVDTTVRWGESTSSTRRLHTVAVMSNTATTDVVRLPRPRPTRSSRLLEVARSQAHGLVRQASYVSDRSDDSASCSGSADESDQEGQDLSSDAGLNGDYNDSRVHRAVVVKKYVAPPCVTGTAVRAPSAPIAPAATVVQQSEPARSHRAFVAHLPSGTDEGTLAAFFAARGLPPARVEIPWDAVARRLKSHAYVTFANAKHLQRALRLSGAVLGGSNLAVREDAGSWNP